MSASSSSRRARVVPGPCPDAKSTRNKMGLPLVVAFYTGVPVLAYAATAVPATMDGAGVLYDDKTPIRVARLMDAIVLNDTVIRRQPAQRVTGTVG